MPLAVAARQIVVLVDEALGDPAQPNPKKPVLLPSGLRFCAASNQTQHFLARSCEEIVHNFGTRYLPDAEMLWLRSRLCRQLGFDP